MKINRIIMIAAGFLSLACCVPAVAQDHVKSVINALLNDKSLTINSKRESRSANPSSKQIVRSNDEYYVRFSESSGWIERLLEAFDKDKDDGYGYLLCSSDYNVAVRNSAGMFQPSQKNTYQNGLSLDFNSTTQSFVCLNVLDPKDHHYRTNYIFCWKKDSKPDYSISQRFYQGSDNDNGKENAGSRLNVDAQIFVLYGERPDEK